MAMAAPPLRLLLLSLLSSRVAAQGASLRSLAAATPAPAPTPAPSPAPGEKPYADAEPATCDLGQNCTDGGVPAVRGLCVQASNPGAGKACWDVCNPAHAPQAYKVDDNAAVTMSYAGMVESVRAGLNPMVSCPNLKGGDPCPPGDFCPAAMLKEFKVPKGRGMCVIDSGKPDSRACLDMCNAHRSIASFTMGTPEGTGATVSATRAGGICPGTPWWFYPVVGICILAILGCCAGGFFLVKSIGARKMKSRSASLKDSCAEEMKPDYGEPLQEEDMEEVPVQQREFMEPMPAQNDYMMQGRAPEFAPPEPPRTPHNVQEPLVGFYDSGAEAQQLQSMRSHQSAQQFPQEMEPPPFTGPVGGGSMAVPAVDPTMITGGSMRVIPGLDQPNLMINNIPALQVPGADAFQQPQQQQYFLGSTQSVQPQMVQSFQAQPQVALPSFHTQVPSGYVAAGGSPPASIQIQPQQAGQRFFTTLQRR